MVYNFWYTEVPIRVREMHQGGIFMEFILLAGGLLVIIIAIIVAVVSSVAAAVAADQDVED